MTTKKANLVGNTFGRLTVTKELPKEDRIGSKTKVTWECLCSCGNYHKATTYQLRSNSVTSCGCNKPPAYEDLTGNIYGMLTVIKPSPKRSRNRQVIWISQCECGSQSEDRADLLKSGGAYSCGCTRRLNNGEDLVGRTYGKLTVTRELPKTEWLHGGKHRTWLCECQCGVKTKATTHTLNNGKKTHCGCSLHRDLSGQKFGMLTVNRKLPKDEWLYNKTHVTWECICECGNLHITTSSGLRGRAVQSCGCLAESLGEQAIKRYLDYSGIPYIQQKTFNDLYCKTKSFPLRFDFAILGPNKNVTQLIEYDGAQHYNPVEYWGGEDTFRTLQERDKLKDEYCRDNGIPLLRIPYTDYNNISDILDKYLITIHERKIIKNA